MKNGTVEPEYIYVAALALSIFPCEPLKLASRSVLLTHGSMNFLFLSLVFYQYDFSVSVLFFSC